MMIHGLRKSEEKTLALLLSMDTFDDIYAYKATKPYNVQCEIDTLIELTRYQIIDNQIDSAGNLFLAKCMIESIGIKT